jgi:hypothetical protein
MLAKWTDRAGQTHSHAIVQRYRAAIRLYPKYVMELTSAVLMDSNGYNQMGKGTLLLGEALQQNSRP